MKYFDKIQTLVPISYLLRTVLVFFIFFKIIIICIIYLNIFYIIFLYIDEVAKQIASCDAKILIGTVDSTPILEEAIKQLPHQLSLLSIRTKNDQTIPNGTIDFSQLMSTTGEYLF